MAYFYGILIPIAGILIASAGILIAGIMIIGILNIGILNTSRLYTPPRPQPINGQNLSVSLGVSTVSLIIPPPLLTQDQTGNLWRWWIKIGL